MISIYTYIVSFFNPVKWSYGKIPLGKLKEDDDDSDVFNIDSKSSKFSAIGVHARSKYILRKKSFWLLEYLIVITL